MHSETLEWIQQFLLLTCVIFIYSLLLHGRDLLRAYGCGTQCGRLLACMMLEWEQLSLCQQQSCLGSHLFLPSNPVFSSIKHSAEGWRSPSFLLGRKQTSRNELSVAWEVLIHSEAANVLKQYTEADRLTGDFCACIWPASRYYAMREACTFLLCFLYERGSYISPLLFVYQMVVSFVRQIIEFRLSSGLCCEYYFDY